jgi:hypothetical protein
LKAGNRGGRPSEETSADAKSEAMFYMERETDPANEYARAELERGRYVREILESQSRKKVAVGGQAQVRPFSSGKYLKAKTIA